MPKIDYAGLMACKSANEFKAKVVKELKKHFGDVLGSDAELLDSPDFIDRIYDKHFGKAA